MSGLELRCAQLAASDVSDMSPQCRREAAPPAPPPARIPLGKAPRPAAYTRRPITYRIRDGDTHSSLRRPPEASRNMLVGTRRHKQEGDR
jgi:hypothetical protein